MKYITYTIIIIIFIDCKKEKTTIQTIRGEVFNLCTDSTMANIPVYLKGAGKKGPSIKLKTISDAAGKFVFENVELRESFEYAVYVPTEYAPVNMYHQKPEFFGVGGAVYFTMNDLIHNPNAYAKIRVSPKMEKFSFKVTGWPITAPDSLAMRVYQPIFIKNNPLLASANDIYLCTCKYWSSENTFFGSAPMGLWKIEIHKYKNNTYTFMRDSIFLPYWGNVTYTINW